MKEYKIDNLNERMEKKNANFCHKELEKASLGEGSNGVVGKTNNERISLMWAYGRHLKI